MQAHPQGSKPEICTPLEHALHVCTPG